MRQIVGGKYITEVPDEASLQITLTPLPHHVFLAPLPIPAILPVGSGSHRLTFVLHAIISLCLACKGWGDC